MNLLHSLRLLLALHKELRIRAPWYWTQGWLAREERALADLEGGRYADFRTIDGLIDALQADPRDPEAATDPIITALRRERARALP